MTRTAAARPVRLFALVSAEGSTPDSLACVPRVAAHLGDRWDRVWSAVELAGLQVADQLPTLHAPRTRLTSVTVSDPQRLFADWIRPHNPSRLTADQRDGCWSNGDLRGRPADGTAGVRFDGGQSVAFLFEADDGSKYTTEPIGLDELTGW